MKTLTKKTCLFLLTALLAACNMPGLGDSATPSSEDQAYPVEYFVTAGILQGHSRFETEYRDLAPGSASLSSGSYLRTLEGEAFVVLPDDSVLKLGANTEVQIGLYDNGIMIWQHSGETLHIVVPREGDSYVVATPFGVVQAHGTEYEIRVDYPAEGWVAIYWGEIGLVQTDPVEVYGLVPEGALILGPEGNLEYFRLEPGDTLSWDIDPATGQPRHSRDTIPPDEEAQHNRDLAQRIRELMEDFWDGTITRDAYHEGLNGILNEALGLTEPEPGSGDVTPTLNLGSLYAGMVGNNIVTFCFDGSHVSRFTWDAEMLCTDKETSDMYVRSYIFHMGADAFSAVREDGYFSLIYQYDPTLSPNTVISAEGNISYGGGSVNLSVRTETDVEVCNGSTTIPVNSSGMDCSGE